MASWLWEKEGAPLTLVSIAHILRELFDSVGANQRVRFVINPQLKEIRCSLV